MTKDKDPFEPEDQVVSKQDVEDLKSGFMKVAKEIGVLKGLFAAHKDEPDAHNPSTMVKK